MKILEVVSIVISLASLVVGFIAKVFLNGMILRTPPKTYLFVAILFLGYAIYANIRKQ